MNKKDKVALIIVFNHRYDKNIDIIEKIYEKRFSNIYYLVPFYDGDKPNVIAVYENSYFFQGYFVQGFKQYFNEDYCHYIFLADDMILNPNINENNYQQNFGLSSYSSFIPEIYSLNNINDEVLYCNPATLSDGLAKLRNKEVKKWFWARVEAAYKYNPKVEGAEIANGLPSYDDALALLERHGVHVPQLAYVDVYGGIKVPLNYKTIIPNIKYLFGHEVFGLKYKLPYPLAGSYSDIIIVSHETIKPFIRYCGIFATTSLFVELAVPTALLFASNNVVTEPIIKKRGQLYWPYSDQRKRIYEAEMQRYEYKIENLIKMFPQDKLYIHPVKLSKWK